MHIENSYNSIYICSEDLLPNAYMLYELLKTYHFYN